AGKIGMCLDHGQLALRTRVEQCAAQALIQRCECSKWPRSGGRLCDPGRMLENVGQRSQELRLAARVERIEGDRRHCVTTGAAAASAACSLIQWRAISSRVATQMRSCRAM